MSDDTTIYVWTIDEEPTVPVVGDFARYAHHWETAYYSGLSVSQYVWSFKDGRPVQHKVDVFYGGTDGDDYVKYHLVIQNTEAVIVRIDGCA